SMDTGMAGEEFACGYLVDKGFHIIERNARAPWGELDIVVVSPDKTLVFVEVKTVRSDNVLSINPEDEMSASKLTKFKKAAYLYANSHPKLVNEDKGWRLDVIAITKNGATFLATHYENV
ncbi:MAG: YraN family protein, partial [Patescibacteria group bacterium]